MRAFVVLSLIALACADVSHLSGYNYQSGGGGAVGGAAFGGGSSFVGCGGSGGSGGAGCGGVGGGFETGASNLSPSVSGGFSAGGSGGGFSAGGSDGGFSGGSDGGFDKEFYSFSANNEDFNEPAASNDVLSSLKKNLQVVFIKGPENHGLEHAVADLARHASEQRTAIYVLNKQPDISGLASTFNQVANQNKHKPEVHFVKYRTPEDAHNAQTQIQNQYASLGGSSQSHEGGVAPVINFASQPASSHYQGAASNVGSSYVPPAPSNAYIPASILRSLRRRV